MTSIRCPDCSSEVTGSQQNCPRCNFPISKLRGLSAAILTRNAERVAGLIQLGADVNAADKSGRTPLITAALMDDAEIVQMLLAAGAKPEPANNAGETALSVSKSREVERLIRRAIVVSRFNSVQKSAPPERVAPPIVEVQDNKKVEALPENPKNEQRIYEESPLDFDQPLTESAVWENRKHFNSETLVSAKVPIKEESTIRFDDSLMFTEASHWENPAANHISRTPIDLQLNEELFEFPSRQEPITYDEPALEFDKSLRFTEVNAWENRAQSNVEPPQIIQDIETTDAAANFDNTLKYNEILEWENPKDDSAWLQQTPPVQNEVIEEVSEPIRDDAEFSEAGQLYSAVSFEPTKTEGPRYFLGAIFGCCLLIVFMALTWPHYSKTPVHQPVQNPKPAKQITKPEPVEPEVIQKVESVVPEETKPADPIPEPTPKSKIVETKLASSSKQKTVGDPEKLRLARALNNQGYSLIKQGKPGEAIPVLERSLQSFPKGTKDPHYGYALYNLALAWRKAGRPDLAIPILEKRMKIENQRDVVARELYATRQEAKNAGFGNFKN